MPKNRQNAHSYTILSTILSHFYKQSSEIIKKVVKVVYIFFNTRYSLDNTLKKW